MVMHTAVNFEESYMHIVRTSGEARRRDTKTHFPYVNERRNFSMQDEMHYLNKSLQFGADGSIVQDGDWVYRVLWHRVLHIARFSGISCVFGHACCETTDEDLCHAPYLLPIRMGEQQYRCGITNRCIMRIQRAWKRKWRTLHHNVIAELAQRFVDFRCR